MQKQSARIKCKNDLFKPCKWHCAFGRNNRVRSKQKYTMIFNIFQAQKSSKSGLTVQGIVQSGLLLLYTELTLFCNELPENCIYLNQSELSNFFMYLIMNVNIYIPILILLNTMLYFYLYSQYSQIVRRSFLSMKIGS